MAIGDAQDGYNEVKPGLPLIQLPRANATTGFFGGHLPLAPADSRQNHYLDTRPETQHQFQTTITTPVENLPPSFNGFSFSESSERTVTPMRRPSRVSVTLAIHGLEDPATVDLEWSLSAGINQDQRNRIDQYIRRVLNDPHGVDARYNTPTRGREASCDSGRRSSWTPDYRGSNYRFVNQQGGRRRAENSLGYQDSPDEDDDDGYQIEVVNMVQIRLGDNEAIREYYTQILRGIQQLALKQVLKEWIKVIEPKKQKNFPYKKDVKPRWWPDAAAWREPDHIKVDDRIHLAIGILRYAQDVTVLNGEGLTKLEQTSAKQELVFENETKAKGVFRTTLMESMFALARAEQQVANEQRDSTEAISLPQVTKYEKPNKKRKKNSSKNKSMDSEGCSSLNMMGAYDQDDKSLLKPTTLKSQGDRASPAPNTPWSRHSTQDSGVSFHSAAEQPHPGMMTYGQQYDTTATIDSRYSSYDEGAIDGANSSPGSAYPSSTTSADNMHMTLSYGQTPAVSLGYSAPCHGLPTMAGPSHGMMPGLVMPSHEQPRVEQVYTAVTEHENRAWTATPATYMPSQPTYSSTSFY